MNREDRITEKLFIKPDKITKSLILYLAMMSVKK